MSFINSNSPGACAPQPSCFQIISRYLDTAIATDTGMQLRPDKHGKITYSSLLNLWPDNLKPVQALLALHKASLDEQGIQSPQAMIFRDPEAIGKCIKDLEAFKKSLGVIRNGRNKTVKDRIVDLKQAISKAPDAWHVAYGFLRENDRVTGLHVDVPGNPSLTAQRQEIYADAHSMTAKTLNFLKDEFIPKTEALKEELLVALDREFAARQK